MTLDQAIKLNEDSLGFYRLFAVPERVEAMMLAVAGLKFIRQQREGFPAYAIALLPGETEE